MKVAMNYYFWLGKDAEREHLIREARLHFCRCMVSNGKLINDPQ